MVENEEENCMQRWARVAVLFLMAGGLILLGACRPTAPPTSLADQIYVSQVANTVLQVLSPEKVASQPTTGDWIDSKSGESLSTADTGYGFVHLSFPGKVNVYLASGTGTILKDAANEQISIDMLLTRGWWLAELPETFSATTRVAVESPEGAQAWVSGTLAGTQQAGSMMGVQYLSATHELYVDCLRGECGYMDGTGSHSLPEGSHISLNGKTALSNGPGNRGELWQFVPNLVSVPTPIPSATPNLAATQACMYFTSLGLSCKSGFPTLTITPSPTLDAAATQECWRNQKLGTPCP